MPEAAIVFRAPRWLPVLLVIAFAVAATGFVVVIHRYGISLRTFGVGAFALFAAAGLLDSLLTRVELQEGALVMVRNFSKSTFPRTDIEAVTWASGAGVVITLADGRTMKLPDVGNSQSRANSIRAWMGRGSRG